jgi:ornithine cyclodeaminase
MSARLALPVLPGSAHAVREADIICTATTSATPVFVDTELPAGVHINGVGSYHATTREIPGETLRRARVVVDSRAAALAEAGDIVLPIREGLITAAHVTGEIGDILLERIPGRENPAEVTLFKSVGNAAQDLAAASLLLDRASRMELGQLVRL